MFVEKKKIANGNRPEYLMCSSLCSQNNLYPTTEEGI